MSDAELREGLARVLKEAGPRAIALLDEATAQLDKAGGRAAALRSRFSEHLAQLARDAQAGLIPLSDAQVSMDRCLFAIGEVAGAEREAEARVALDRAHKVLYLVRDLALAAARVGAMAALAGL
jgi:hypothetical protein